MNSVDKRLKTQFTDLIVSEVANQVLRMISEHKRNMNEDYSRSTQLALLTELDLLALKIHERYVCKINRVDSHEA